jgi:sulfide:quinone oxidoreductase
LVTAQSLRKRLPRGHRVVLVDRQRDHVFAPSLLWLMTGKRTPAGISRPLGRLARTGIEVIHGEIDRIDPDARRVVVGDRELEAEHLIVSLGVEFAPEAIPGLGEAGHNFYELEGAENLRDALAEFNGGRVVILTATAAYKCPAAPYEAAMLLLDHCRRRGIGDRTTIDLYAAEPGPMGVTGPEVSALVRGMVESQGITVHSEHQVTSVDPTAGTITFANGATAGFDLLAYVPPHRAPQVVRDSGLLDQSDWIPVDRATLATRFDGVYAIGDVTGIPLKMGKPLPKAGVFAERQAEVVSRNIARIITGKGEPASFDGHGECFIETGGGRAGFGAGNFYAEPLPQVTLHPPSRRFHLGKLVFEQNWLRRRI